MGPTNKLTTTSICPTTHTRRAHLVSHNVLLFGSSASVWGNNRFGDAMVSVSRVILLCPTTRYVDDYGGTEIQNNADSGFQELQAFEDFSGALGYNMKTSKRQPPASSHKIQGVIISTEPHHITFTPCPQRVQRMCQEIQTCLQQNSLKPDQARRMAGKCNFLTGRLFGKVGRAPLKVTTFESILLWHVEAICYVDCWSPTFVVSS